MQRFIFVKNVKVTEHFRHSTCQSSMFVRVSPEERITLKQDLGLCCEGEEDVKSALFKSSIDFHTFYSKDFHFNIKITSTSRDTVVGGM